MKSSLAAKRAFPDPPSFERTWGTSITSVATAGTRRYYLGRSRGGLIVARDIVLLVDTTIARNATDYYTFAPFVVNDAGALHYLGTAKGTNATFVTAEVPFRIHEEATLDYHLLAGMALGVEIVSVTSGSLAAARMSLLGSLDYAA